MEAHSRAKVKHFLRRATRATCRARTRDTHDDATRITPSTDEIRAQRRHHVRNARPAPRVVVKTRGARASRFRAAHFVVDANGRPEIFRDAARNASAGDTRDVARPANATTSLAAHAPSRAARASRACERRDEEAARDAGRDEARDGSRASMCGSPEQIRTAVTALRGRRPRPLDDGAGFARCSRWIPGWMLPTGSGGRTRTPNDRARTCCVADYTTPEGGRTP